jgi:hypothetical protein
MTHRCVTGAPAASKQEQQQTRPKPPYSTPTDWLAQKGGGGNNESQQSPNPQARVVYHAISPVTLTQEKRNGITALQCARETLLRRRSESYVAGAPHRLNAGAVEEACFTAAASLFAA